MDFANHMTPLKVDKLQVSNTSINSSQLCDLFWSRNAYSDKKRIFDGHVK